jgi:CHAD domain-containing protein/HD superfamily phosphodiesterase
MMAMDPEPDWKAMKKAGKRLFQQLGALRDTQIMMEWIEKLELAELGANKSEVAADGATDASVDKASVGEANPAAAEPSAEPIHSPAHILLHILQSRETDQKHEARAALEEFDRKEWRQWSKSLPQRASHIRPGSAVFKHLALERWTSARELHARAMRNRSQVAFHTLRIGIKRFRYIVENFLPAEHKAWSDDLKHMQDLLGEVHDLDVLWATALHCHVFPDASSRKEWHEKVLEERTKRIEEYREKTVGENSLWNIWRAGLPQGKRIQEIATRRMKLWASALDPDFAHSERVAHMALELYDGLGSAGLLNSSAVVNRAPGDARASLYAAALLHDVGKSKKKKGHHKESLELIQKHGAPLGWSSENLQRASIVARFHCGALPSRSHKSLRDLLPEEQKTIIALAAVLRLANALDSAHDGHVRRVKIENGSANPSPTGRRVNGLFPRPALAKNEAVVIAAEGYSPGSPTAQAVAAERYLLETVLRRPVVVRQAASLQRTRPEVRLAS